MSDFAHDPILSQAEREDAHPAPGKIECSICGGFPVGEGCYHICPNSDHYYSPEQEREDDAWYGEDDHRERYAAELRDLELEAAADEAYWASLPEDHPDHTPLPVTRDDFLVAVAPVNDDDIPF